MSGWIDKSVILLISLLLFYKDFSLPILVTGLLLAVIASIASDYFEDRRVAGAIFVLYHLLCALFPALLIFIPILYYNISKRFLVVYFLISASVMLLHRAVLSTDILMNTGILTALTLLFSYRALRAAHLLDENLRQRDNLKEISEALRHRINDILTEQDYEVRLATLNERNRIARDIHDNVGHVLSGAILQVGALLATDSEHAAELNVLKDQLNKGMDSIRNSVHDLRDESIHLDDQLQRLTTGFTFCEMKLTYDVIQPPETRVKYAVLAIVKEALSNIMRHSNATAAEVSLYERPGVLQLTIQDNGSTKPTYNIGAGMGLENIRQRVYALGGAVNFTAEHGFKIFASFPIQKQSPKEEATNENHPV